MLFRIYSLLVVGGYSLLLSGCTDLMMMDNGGFVNQQQVYTSYYHTPSRPVRNVHTNRYYHTTHYNDYYEDPQPLYYQPAPRRAQYPAAHANANAQAHVHVYNQPAPQPQYRAAPAYHQPAAPQNQGRQAQIASDRAMAQRLQNEEYVRAQRQAEQIASDRALAERLQAEEFAR